MEEIKTVLRMALMSESKKQNAAFINELEGYDYEMYEQFGIQYGIEAQWFFDKLMDYRVDLPAVLKQLVKERPR